MVRGVPSKKTGGAGKKVLLTRPIKGKETVQRGPEKIGQVCHRTGRGSKPTRSKK